MTAGLPLQHSSTPNLANHFKRLPSFPGANPALGHYGGSQNCEPFPIQNFGGGGGDPLLQSTFGGIQNFYPQQPPFDLSFYPQPMLQGVQSQGFPASYGGGGNLQFGH
jgi:hypothetical protein